MSNAMLLQRIVLAGELYDIFNRSLKVECNVAAKDCILPENRMTYSIDYP
uniref:Uncharacterized protein n=1 Tax=viral metagenome TaxID=1070528 RepID=A0A6C0C9L8_9ZZZZ